MFLEVFIWHLVESGRNSKLRRPNVPPVRYKYLQIIQMKLMKMDVTLCYPTSLTDSLSGKKEQKQKMTKFPNTN